MQDYQGWSFDQHTCVPQLPLATSRADHINTVITALFAASFSASPSSRSCQGPIALWPFLKPLTILSRKFKPRHDETCTVVPDRNLIKDNSNVFSFVALQMSGFVKEWDLDSGQTRDSE